MCTEAEGVRADGRTRVRVAWDECGWNRAKGCGRGWHVRASKGVWRHGPFLSPSAFLMMKSP